jgi:hypothetical protein
LSEVSQQFDVGTRLKFYSRIGRFASHRWSAFMRPGLHASVRQLLLALVFVGIVGLAIELALLRHAESFTQWIPHVTLFIGLVSTLAVCFRPGAGSLRVFRVVMVIFVVVGILGIFLHFRGNVEFALERYPSVTRARLIWKALRGATPALAPGALTQLGLLGLLFAYRHPVLEGRNTDGQGNVG